MAANLPSTKAKYRQEKSESGRDVDIMIFDRPDSATVRAHFWGEDDGFLPDGTGQTLRGKRRGQRQKMKGPMKYKELKGEYTVIQDDTIMYYPSGNLALVCQKDGNGILHNFYDDKKTPFVIASFKEGVGFASFQNGKPRFSSTKRGGSLLNERGQLVQEWAWDGTFRAPAPGPEPEVALTLSPGLRLACRSRREVVLTLRRRAPGGGGGGGGGGGFVGADQVEINVAEAGPAESYLQRLAGKAPGGRLLVRPRGSKALTLRERQGLAARNPGLEAVREAQRRGRRLPAVSASGRELREVPLGGDLAKVGASLTDLKASLREFRTEIGQNVYDSTHDLRFSNSIMNLPPGTPDSDDDFLPQRGMTAKTDDKTVLAGSLVRDNRGKKGKLRGALGGTRQPYRPPVLEELSHSQFVAPSKLPRRPRTLFPPEVVPARQLARRAAAEGGGGGGGDLLLIACLSVRNTAESRSAEKMMTKINSKWHTLPEEESNDYLKKYKIILVDCGKDKCLARQYNFENYPLYLMFYNGRLAFASATFNGFGNSEEDFEAQIEKTLAEGKKGVLLPENFRFPSSNDFTLKTAVYRGGQSY